MIYYQLESIIILLLLLIFKKKTVGYRGFGSKREHLIPWSIEFNNETQNKNIIATAKHFPGHGLVSGDTHQSSSN